MAGGAIALVRILEQRETAFLGRRQHGLACEEGIELAVEAVKFRVLDLELRDRSGESRKSRIGIVERLGTEHLPEACRTRRARQARDHLCGRRIRHLARIEERLLRLLRQRRHAAIAEEAAERRALLVIAEGRREARIADRRRVADPGTSMPSPPFDTRSPGGAAWANSGRWQVWQDSRPDADRDSSRNNCSPRAATGDRPGVDGAANAAGDPTENPARQDQNSSAK